MIRDRQGRVADAATDRERALEIAREEHRPESYSTRVRLARALALAGQIDEARAIAGPLLDAGAADPGLLEALAASERN